jgi:serine/threonine protein kinase
VQLKHPNLVAFIDYFDDAEYCFLVMEIMTGGELFTRIVEKEKYSEAEAQKVVRTLTSAIAYCHSQNVVHRDLKVRLASALASSRRP